MIASVDLDAAAGSEYVVVAVAGQSFGIPVASVRDVLGPQKITPVPLSPIQVEGALNLRGRIATAICLRRCLELPPRAADQASMNVVVEDGGELYSLIVDRVGEVLTPPADAFERNLPTLSARWRDVSRGVFKLADDLLVVLDVRRLLGAGTVGAGSNSARYRVRGAAA
jgi:purine-binding chemotaxis protein CheW